MKKQAPTFVKWAGGKKQLIEQFKPLFPKKINRFFDVFMGGGAIAFFIIKNYRPKEIFISDINEELINTLNIIKTDVENLIKELKKLKSLHSKENFYKVRAEDPKLLSNLKRASRFIYLNKTCFNGLYRVNSKGGFNVPFNNSKNPLICPEEDLREISQLLKNAKIEVKQFYKIENEVRNGDFCYFDPPYYPIKRESFTTYTKEVFLEKEQERLAELFKDLDKKGVNVMLSNSDTNFIRELYKDYSINIVKANRMINCDGKGRGKINELVVINYPLNTKVQKIL